MPPLKPQDRGISSEGVRKAEANAPATRQQTATESSTVSRKKQGAPILATYQRYLLRQKRREEKEDIRTKESLQRRWCVLQKYKECLEEGLRVLEGRSSVSGTADNMPSSKELSENNSSTRQSSIHRGNTSDEDALQAPQSPGGDSAAAKSESARTHNIHIKGTKTSGRRGEEECKMHFLNKRESVEGIVTPLVASCGGGGSDCAELILHDVHPQRHLMHILRHVGEQCAEAFSSKQLHLSGTRRKAEEVSQRRRCSTASNDMRHVQQNTLKTTTQFRPLSSRPLSADGPQAQPGRFLEEKISSQTPCLRKVRFRSSVGSSFLSDGLHAPNSQQLQRAEAATELSLAQRGRVQLSPQGSVNSAAARQFPEPFASSRKSAIRRGCRKESASSVHPLSSLAQTDLPRRVHFLLQKDLVSKEKLPRGSFFGSACEVLSLQPRRNHYAPQTELVPKVFYVSAFQPGVHSLPFQFFLEDHAPIAWLKSLHEFSQEFRHHLSVHPALEQDNSCEASSHTPLFQVLSGSEQLRLAPFCSKPRTNASLCFPDEIALALATNVLYNDQHQHRKRIEKQQREEEVRHLRRLLLLKNRLIKRLVSGEAWTCRPPGCMQQNEHALLQEHRDRHDLLGAHEKQMRYEGWQRLCLRAVRQPLPPTLETREQDGTQQSESSTGSATLAEYPTEYVNSILQRFANANQRRLMIGQMVQLEHTASASQPALQLQYAPFPGPQTERPIFYQASPGVLISSEHQAMQDLPFVQEQTLCCSNAFFGASRGVMRNGEFFVESLGATTEGSANQRQSQTGQSLSEEPQRLVLLGNVDLENAISST